jgi:hypothetical protein
MPSRRRQEQRRNNQRRGTIPQITAPTIGNIQPPKKNYSEEKT